ncbi:DUF4432 family protein [Alsobacter sp. SYSU M60028]|uniref:DUF4432 family protein n=1 Tax=Alsobacter ponti TaxID=2962936 RepID=A0ABT1LJI9_9HYPH|nr:DUF4432 family protein [Alsobacter ponti]MCP8941106.1 DUF4432 family protein [Alsobacter ponti]
MTPDPLRPIVGDLRQIASVRPIVLDDGPERGVRALAFSTGGGLDFWVMAERSLDIGPLWYRGSPVAWQSPAGFRSPTLHDPEGDGGHGFNRSFSGLLVTCGLEHIRQPVQGRPLHGRLPFTPARVLAHGEDWEAPQPTLFCEGDVVQSRYGGETLRLRRRISAPVGGQTLSILDRVTNEGAQPTPHALLYHVNFGYPAVATGTEIHFGGRRVMGPITLPDPGPQPDAVSMPSGPGEIAACQLITPTPEGPAFRLTLSFSAGTLPHLQLWRDLRPQAGVLSLEPCTSARLAGGASPPPEDLAPGQSRQYRVDLTFSGTALGLPCFADPRSAP